MREEQTPLERVGRPPSAEAQLSGEQLARITREVVRLKAHYYGRGPTAAKSYSCDNFIFTVLEGGLTPVEQTLLDHREEDMVRAVRLRYQKCMEDLYRAMVEDATGRRALNYQSQVLFDPMYTVEIFVLEPLPEGQDGAGA
jgi:uncharacterized protein YbcI